MYISKYMYIIVDILFFFTYKNRHHKTFNVNENNFTKHLKQITKSKYIFKEALLYEIGPMYIV